MPSPKIARELRLEYRTPAEPADNPSNWREHPPGQLAALKDVIGEVGWAGALLLNERTGKLIDGHARKKIATEGKVPVLIGSWSEEEEKLILASLDPLAAMAEANGPRLRELLGGIETHSAAIQTMLDGIMPQALDDIPPPEAFAEYDEDIDTEHKCPKCGYSWSGKSK